MTVADSGGRIQWTDEPLAKAFEELRALDGGEDAVASIGSECLAAMFLVAHGLDAAAALQAMLATAEWRGSNGAAAFRAKLLSKDAWDIKDFPHAEHVLKCTPMHESEQSVTRAGMPYALRCLGLVDAEALFAVCSEDDLLEWQVAVSEARLLRLEAFARREGRLGHLTTVQDMTCPVGLVNLWLKNRGRQHIMRKVTHTADTHYPGMLGKILLVNAPWAIELVLKAMWPILPARIAEKVEAVPVFQTRERMRELVDPSRLPRFLGGDIPDEEFVPTRQVPSNGADGEEEVVIAAGSRDERHMPLEEGHTAAYGFTVAGNAFLDIMFSCHFETDGGDTIQVKAPERVKEASGGSFTAPKRGRLALVFDNGYSWVNSKTVSVELSQLPPQGEAEQAPK